MNKTEILEQTSFLPLKSRMKQRLWHIENNIFIIPLCPICNVKERKWYRWYHGKNNVYTDFCSTKCAANSQEVRDKYVATNIEKYGFENPRQSKIVDMKIRATNLERYGVEIAASAKDVIDKVAKTNIKRYGVKSTLTHKETKDKIIISNIERYGSANPFGSVIIKDRIKESNVEKYGVENPQQNEIIREKTRRSCLEKYGVGHALQSEIVKDKIKQTNVEKYGVENIQQRHLSVGVLKKLNDKSWLEHGHNTLKQTLAEMAKELGVHPTTVHNYFKKYDIDQHRWFGSIGQKNLAQYIEELGVELVYNDRTMVSPYELDIYIAGYNLAIEYCGLHWHSELYVDSDYHLKKLELCEKKGIRLLTIYEEEWMYKQDIVKAKVRSILGLDCSKKVYARKCHCEIVSTNTKKDFYEKYHIQGNGPGSIHYGLVYDNILVACMSFIKIKINEYYLNRYSTSCVVPGGFSKLLKYFIDQNQPRKIITFADRRWSNGELYSKNGFSLIEISKPDYRYIIKDRTYHKFNFRHKHLSKMLGGRYNLNYTERQNCFECGIFRIYDCGLLKFELIPGS